MALVNFKKGTSADYLDNQSTYANYIYVCEDTRDLYVFGVLQQGISDEQFQKLTTNLDQSILEVINGQKNTANGIAGLDENGKIDPSLINGVIGHIVEVQDFVASNPDPVEEGKCYFNTTSNKILVGGESAWTEEDPQSSILYVRLGADDRGLSNVIYRWGGTAMAVVSDTVVLGETTGSAYDGAKGKENRDALNSMASTVVTGFGAVTQNTDNVTIAFTDSDKNTGNNQYAAGDGGNITIGVASTTQAGMMSAADKVALDALAGEGEGSLTEISETIAALDAAAVKKIKVGTGAELTPTEGLVTIANATTSADGAMAKEDKAKVDKIVTTGDGSQFLANNGTYKTVQMDLSEDYAASTEVNEALEPAAGDSYETAIGKLHKAILDNEEVTTQTLVNFQTVLGTQNPNQTLPDLSGTNYLQSASTFVACLQALDTALKTVATQAATITDLTSRVEALEDALTLKTV